MSNKQIALPKKQATVPSSDVSGAITSSASLAAKKNDNLGKECKPTAKVQKISANPLPTHHPLDFARNDRLGHRRGSISPFNLPYYGMAEIHAYATQRVPIMGQASIVPPPYTDRVGQYGSYYEQNRPPPYHREESFPQNNMFQFEETSFYFPDDVDDIPPPPKHAAVRETAAAPPPSPQQRVTDDVNPFDVLTGKGAPTTFHYGNQYLNELARQHGKLYLCSKRSDKPRIAAYIIQEIHVKGGRFLQRVKGSRGKHGGYAWAEISETHAYEKVCKLLREAAPRIEKEVSKDLGKENSLNRADV